MNNQSIRNHNKNADAAALKLAYKQIKTLEANHFTLFTRNRLSDRWAVSTETLKRMEKDGRLPCLKIGRGVRYRLADIERIEAEAELVAR